MEIKDEEYVFPTEVMDLLQERDEEELEHEQKIALEKLTRHVQIDDLDTLEELSTELSEVADLKDKHIYKILEVLPEHESTVRAIFSKERVKLDDSEIEDILEITRSVDVE